MAILQSDVVSGKKLFERAQYKKALALFKKVESKTFDTLVAAGIKDNSHELEALSYLGLMYENGLGCEVDLVEARKYYGRAYHEGLYSAGISLAKIEYNTGHEDLAIALYKSITEIKTIDDPMAKASAIYNLAKIYAAKQNMPDGAINRLYDDAIAIYKEHYPESSYHAEILYSKAQLQLKKATKHNLKDVEAIFQEAAEMGYVPAEISYLDMQAKSLFERGNNEEALEYCEQALILDPVNVDIKVTKATILEQAAQAKSLNILDSVEEYDQVLDLARQIMLSDPSHKGKGYALKKELENSLGRVLSLSICDNLKNLAGQNSEKMILVVDELGPQISSFLKQSDSLLQQASFKDVPQIANNLAQEILLENRHLLENISENIDIRKAKKEGKLGSAKNLPDKTSGFRNKLILNVKNTIEGASKTNIPISEDDQKHVLKRLAFKEAIQNRLNSLYDVCQEVLEDDSNIEVALQDDSSYETWNAYLKQKVQFVAPYVPEVAQDILVTMAPMAGLVVGGALVIASSIVKPVLPKMTEFAVNQLGLKDQYDQKELLKISAKSFCEKLNFAQRKNEYSKIIAEELTKKYGAQIDNISQQDMRKLAHVAVKKMFNQIHNKTKKDRAYSALPKNYFNTPEENTVEYFVDAVANSNNRDKFTAVMDVNPIFGGRWKIDDAFERPAITINGKDFYTNSSSDISYGCMYQETKPLGYKINKNIPFADGLKLEEDFKNNARRIAVMNREQSSQGQENKINEELREHKKNVYLSEKKQGKLNTKIGAALNVAAITVGVLIGIGLMGPFFVIPAAVACIAGLVILRNGLQKDINASENLKVLEKPEVSINREIGEQRQAVQQKQVEGKFTQKFAQRTKPDLESLKNKKPERASEREVEYNRLAK